MSGRPGWLDDSLAEEWVEPDEVDMSLEDDVENAQQLSRSVLVSPLTVLAHGAGEQQSRRRHLDVNHDGNRHASASGSSVTAVPSSPSLPPPSSPRVLDGTFLIREDVEHQPVTPAMKASGVPFRKGKGRGKQLEAFTKSIFSPLALEKMFDPPSPPEARTLGSGANKSGAANSKLQSPLIPLPISEPSRPDNMTQSPHQRGVALSPQNASDGGENDTDCPDEILASDIPNLVGFNGRVPSARFTFQTPHSPTTAAPRRAAVLNHPNPSARRPGGRKPHAGLKLFQRYDTYTKDHLSALVESIDVKSSPPSTSGHDDGDSFVYRRSTKRIRLSAPESDRKSVATTKSRRGPSPLKSSPQRPPPVGRPDDRVAPRDYLGESRSLMEQIKNNRSFSLGTMISQRDNKGLSFVNEDDDEDSGIAPLRPGKVSTAAGTYKQQAASLMAQIKSDVQGKENEDPRYNSNPSRSGTSGWSDANSIHRSFGKLSLNPRQTDRARSATPPTITVEPNSPTEPLPELPRPLVNEPESEPSVPPRDMPPSQQEDVRVQGRQPPSRAFLPIPGAAELGLSRHPSLSTVPSSSRFTVASGQRSGSGTSATSIGTTITATTNNSQASVGSNVKRAGSPARARLRTIAPDEVGPITRVGDMRWDPERMLWTKDRVKSQTLNPSRKRDRAFVDEDGYSDTGQDEDISEDVFRDIESLKDGTGNTTTSSLPVARMLSSGSPPPTRIPQRHPFLSSATRELGSDPRAVSDGASDDEHIDYTLRQPMHVPADDSEGEVGDTPSESDGGTEFDSGAADPDAGRTLSPLPEDLDKLSGTSYVSRETSSADLQRNFEATFSDEEESYQQARVEMEDRPVTPPFVKGIPGTTHDAPTATPRPILIPSQSTPHPFPHANARPRPLIALVPPRSALKQTPSPSAGGGPSTPATNGKYTRKHRRSVSFSDGKKDGKIQNLSVGRHVDENEDDGHDQSVRDDSNNDDQSGEETSVSIAQSTHTRRIEGMLVALETCKFG